MKIGIIGVGRIGSQIAFLSLMKFRPDKMILIDTKDLTGDTLDLQHACRGL
jgi:malate/lactate dehydrogenase